MKENKFNYAVKNTILMNGEIKERLSALSEINLMPRSIMDIQDFLCLKLTAGNKYFIIKTKSSKWLEAELNRSIKAYNMNGLKTDNLFYPLVRHIHNTGYFDVDVDILSQDTNAYNVIKAEYLALKKSNGDSKCLNKLYEPYMPKYNDKTKMYGWLTVNQFLNYNKLLKSENK